MQIVQCLINFKNKVMDKETYYYQSNMTKLEKLIEFVKEKHSKQVRKYTGEPYFNHLKNVAELTSNIKRGHYATEIAYCHDLLEDTTITDNYLLKKLVDFGYNYQIAYHIVNTVLMITDYFTKKNYPELNRKARKELEFLRMKNISPLAQNIKCCDILDNLKDIAVYDKKFASVYIPEKLVLIQNFKHAQSDLIELIMSDYSCV